MSTLRDRPNAEIISGNLLNSVGIKVKRTMSGIKFVYRQEIVDELKQLGFSIDVLKVKGGEVPLPVLRNHVDEQATLESYWGAQAELARYELNVVQDKFDYWFQTKFSKCFHALQERGIPKPTEKEVNARISSKFGTELLKQKDLVRLAERKYRMLCNACYASIVTKGKMLQTLRNIIQGGNVKMASVEVETGGNIDVTRMRVE